MWVPRPERLILPDDEVHVWRAQLNQTSQQVERLLSLLAPDEKSRAERFHFERDRKRFIVSHGILRAILGEYLNLNPAQLQFSYNAYGKPALMEEGGSSGIRFNLSHSQSLALYAIARHRELGVDIEYMRPEFAGAEIAEKFFSPTEVAALRSTPVEQQTEAFFNCWTRKEAYIKARGEGLSFPLDRFNVSLTTGEPEVTLNVPESPDEAARWSLQMLMPGDGYAAAIAVEGHDWNLKCWQA